MLVLHDSEISSSIEDAYFLAVFMFQRRIRTTFVLLY
jgi:hypothetical protein